MDEQMVKKVEDGPLTAVPGGLTDQEILDRVKIGETFVKRFAGVDRTSCQRFRDPSTATLYMDGVGDDDTGDGGNVLQDLPVGLTNQLQINLYTKLAAITISEPDFHVRAEDSRAIEPVRREMKRQWTGKNWQRVAQKAYLKRGVSGMGCVAYRWDREKRTCFEHVHSWDLIADPCVADWQNLDWGGRRLKLSLRKAVELFDPEGKAGYFTDRLSEKDGGYQDKQKVEVRLYWDRKTEAVVYDGRVIRRSENRYGEVPLLFLEGDIDPGPSPWPLGDGQLAAGPQAELSELTSMISNIAKHGGPLNVIDATLLTKSIEQAWTDGRQQGLIPVKGMPERAFMRIGGEEITQAQIEAKTEALAAIDSVMGVSTYMRGQSDPSVRFATQAAIIQQNSGSRGVQARKEYERLLDRMAGTVVRLEVEFGGATLGADGRVAAGTREAALWHLFQSVEEVRVIESSTVYRDPAQDQQQCMQLFATTAQHVPLLLQLGLPAGVALALLLKLKTDELRAFGRTNIDEYLPGVQKIIDRAVAEAEHPQPSVEPGGRSPMGVVPPAAPAGVAGPHLAGGGGPSPEELMALLTQAGAQKGGR